MKFVIVKPSVLKVFELSKSFTSDKQIKYDFVERYLMGEMNKRNIIKDYRIKGVTTGRVVATI